jgi:hypothetical protein
MYNALDSPNLICFYSTMFADMFLIPPPTTAEESKKPLTLDFPASLISIFLDMVSSNAPTAPELSLQQVAAILDLVRAYDCNESIMKAVRAGLEAAGKRAPFDLLVFANGADDVELGKKAISYMSWEFLQQLAPSRTDIRSTMNRLTPSWRLVFFQAVIGSQFGIYDLKHEDGVIAVASFEPVDCGQQRQRYEQPTWTVGLSADAIVQLRKEGLSM